MGPILILLWIYDFSWIHTLVNDLWMKLVDRSNFLFHRIFLNGIASVCSVLVESYPIFI